MLLGRYALLRGTAGFKGSRLRSFSSITSGRGCITEACLRLCTSFDACVLSPRIRMFEDEQGLPPLYLHSLPALFLTQV